MMLQWHSGNGDLFSDTIVMMILWHNSNDVSVSEELSISDASIEFELWRSSVSTMQAEWRHWYQLVENLQVSVMQAVNLNSGIEL